MKRNDLYPSDGVAIDLGADTTGLNLCGLYVGGAGDVVLTTVKGTDLTFKAVPVGSTLELGIQAVKSTANGTTASNLIGLKP